MENDLKQIDLIKVARHTSQFATTELLLVVLLCQHIIIQLTVQTLVQICSSLNGNLSGTMTPNNSALCQRPHLYLREKLLVKGRRLRLHIRRLKKSFKLSTETPNKICQ
jgi:hypothetical protein